MISDHHLEVKHTWGGAHPSVSRTIFKRWASQMHEPKVRLEIGAKSLKHLSIAAFVAAFSLFTVDAVEARGRCIPSACADTVIVNGNIRTGIGNATATAIAVRAGRIIAIGSDRDIRALIGPKTNTIDTRGKTVLPGFIDVHTHLDAIADYERLLSVHVPPLRDLDAVLAKIQEEIAKVGPGKWIVAVGGWGQPMPTKEQLDKIAPHNPVVVRESIHAQVLNSVALAEAGITRSFKTPEGGAIDRDGAGNPTGRIQELAYLWASKLPRPTYSERKASLLKVLQEFAKGGVTSIGDFPQAQSMKIYQELHEEGKLPVRLRFNLFTSGNKGGAKSEASESSTAEPANATADTYDNFLISLGPRTGFGDDWLRLGCAKLFIDGETLSAVRYDDPIKRTTWKGDLRISQPDLNAFVEKAHRAGWQVCIHAMGDKAQDMALEAIEKAQVAMPRPDPRHRIEHMGINEAGPTTDRQLELAQRLGVLPILTPAWIFLGPEAFKTMKDPPFIYRRLLDKGFKIPGSSDSAGSMPESWRPFFSIWTQVARKTRTGELNSPEQAINVGEAIRGWTLDSAYAEFSEADKGSLEIGKLADMIIVQADPFAVSTDEIKNIEVLTTIVGGEIVYEKSRNGK